MLPFEKRILNLFREQAFVADLLKRTALESVTGRADDLNAALVDRALPGGP